VSKKHTYKYVYNKLKKLGFGLLSDYTDARSIITVKCTCGKKWKTRYACIVYGKQSCNDCAQNKKRQKLAFSYDYVKKYIKALNGILISKEYINSGHPIKIKCLECNNLWETVFGDIKRGHWCMKCAANKRARKVAYTQSYVNGVIKKKGGTLLNEYKSVDTKLEISDQFGHSWSQTFKSILDDVWCPYCSGRKITKDDFKSIVTNNDGKLLNFEGETPNSKCKIKCNKCDYIWNTTIRAIKYDKTWCPNCNVRKRQSELTNLIKSIFAKYTIICNYRGFKWLNTERGGRQELDIYIPEIKLAIEYDGEQHFRPVAFGGISEKRAEENFKRTKQLDGIKNRKIKKHTNDIKYFIRFSYKENITKELVIERLIDKGITIP